MNKTPAHSPTWPEARGGKRAALNLAQYLRFITEPTAFLRYLPSEVLRNGGRAVAASLCAFLVEIQRADKYPVGMIPSLAHCPASMTLPWRGSLVAIERIMAPLPQLLAAQLAEYTVDGDRGVAKPLMTLDGTPFDLEPMQKEPVMQPNSRRAQAGIYRAILASAWG